MGIHAGEWPIRSLNCSAVRPGSAASTLQPFEKAPQQAESLHRTWRRAAINAHSCITDSGRQVLTHTMADHEFACPDACPLLYSSITARMSEVAKLTNKTMAALDPQLCPPLPQALKAPSASATASALRQRAETTLLARPKPGSTALRACASRVDRWCLLASSTRPVSRRTASSQSFECVHTQHDQRRWLRFAQNYVLLRWPAGF
jgi:hypothetical protein